MWACHAVRAPGSKLTRGGVLWKFEPHAPFVDAGVNGVTKTILFAATVEGRHAG